MVLKPMIRNNICINAHPVGLEKDVEDQIAYVKKQGSFKGPKNVLIIGSSTGFGLASRISLAFGAGASTLGLAFEKEPSEKRVGTPGHYNTVYFDRKAKEAGLKSLSLNGDAFSHETKAEVVKTLKENFGPVDLVVYSLASPVRPDPDSDTLYKSVLKPLGQSYTAKAIDPSTGVIKETTIEPANQDELEHTVKVMGGEDWLLWVKALVDGGVMAQGAHTVAYSYIGPKVTEPVYRLGTIGKAKEHLEQSADEATKLLAPVGGKAYVSVNKALVTRSSAVIPVVPLYLALLFKIMKEKGIHEGCIEQMYRLYTDRVYGQDLQLDEKGRIRIDDWEMREDVQAEVNKLWPLVTSENVSELGDLATYNSDFLGLHGFGREDVDYGADVSPIV